MTQFEAEELVRILKRRHQEEKELIEKTYSLEREQLEADRKHTINRLSEKEVKAQKELAEAKAEMFRTHKSSEEWKEKVLKVKELGASLKAIVREISDMKRYYQNEFQANRDKRDSKFRNLVTQYSIEHAKIMIQVERKPKEDQVNYWKQKFYRAEDELKKLKEISAA